MSVYFLFIALSLFVSNTKSLNIGNGKTNINTPFNKKYPLSKPLKSYKNYPGNSMFRDPRLYRKYPLSKNYYEDEDEKKLTYCGFSKEHPHNDEIIIRLGFKEETDHGKIKVLFNNIILEAIEHFSNILEQIK